MDNQKLGMFTAQEKHLKPMQGELIEAPKEIEQEAPKHAEVESPMVRSVLDAYFKAAIEEAAIASQYGYEVQDVVKILREYQDGKYRIMRFSPILHDRIVEFFWANPSLPTRDIQNRFYLRLTAGNAIISGKYYAGLKYTKESVKAKYDEIRNTIPATESSGSTTLETIDKLTDERDQLKQRVQELEELIWKQEDLIRCIREFASMAPVAEVLGAE